jgi:hypothetical protein
VPITYADSNANGFAYTYADTSSVQRLYHLDYDR